MKLNTEIEIPVLPVRIAPSDRIMVLGSCFADNIGRKLEDAGFDVCTNPFGTLYNPLSLLSALSRLDSGEEFTPGDCVEMGAGAALVCSFHHHTSFARADAAEFLENANAALRRASEFWKGCNRLIVTFGTAFVWERVEDGMVVSNCLKRPACEFRRRMLGIGEIESAVAALDSLAAGRGVIYTVSPIRHLGQGAHQNTLSKSSLHIAIGEGRCYFPSYEILIDELRDYRFYAENDLCHPSPLAVDVIWEKFKESAMDPRDIAVIEKREKETRRSAHRELLCRR